MQKLEIELDNAALIRSIKGECKAKDFSKQIDKLKGLFENGGQNR